MPASSRFTTSTPVVTRAWDQPSRTARWNANSRCGAFQGFLTITTETDSSAEGVVFKVKQNAAAGIAAKISFYVREAPGDTPESEQESPAVAATPPSPPPAYREYPAASEMLTSETPTVEKPPVLIQAHAPPFSPSKGPLGLELMPWTK